MTNYYKQSNTWTIYIQVTPEILWLVSTHMQELSWMRLWPGQKWSTLMDWTWFPQHLLPSWNTRYDKCTNCSPQWYSTILCRNTLCPTTSHHGVSSCWIWFQIAFSYGYGSVEPWSFMPNVVYIPGALYNLDEDETQWVMILSTFAVCDSALFQNNDESKGLWTKTFSLRQKKNFSLCCLKTYLMFQLCSFVYLHLYQENEHLINKMCLPCSPEERAWKWG